MPIMGFSGRNIKAKLGDGLEIWGKPRKMGVLADLHNK